MRMPCKISKIQSEAANTVLKQLFPVHDPPVKCESYLSSGKKGFIQAHAGLNFIGLSLVTHSSSSHK